MARRKILDPRGEIPNLWIFDQIRLGESYTSLVLGILVVVIVSFLLVVFIKGKSITQTLSSQIISQIAQEEVSVKTEKISSKTAVFQTSKENFYTVVRGDTLWSIAEKKYKSGEKWTEIAKANKLSDPNLLFADNKLVLPEIKEAIEGDNSNILASSSSINGPNYTVQKNDYLWDIAVRAYGDGYKWVEIAKANNLSDPNLIFSGDSLKIPRETTTSSS